MGWLGLDDTDHLGGGCTTYSLFELLQNLPSDYQVNNFRLVRLYPFARRRTRGNAAVAVEILGQSDEKLIDYLDQWWVQKILPLKGMVTDSSISNRTQFPADPGMVWFETQPDEATYWNCVQREVTIDEIPNAKISWGGHGKIGATAAVAWPADTFTFEAISWRQQTAIDNCLPRRVDFDRLRELDNDPNIFMSRDLRSKSVLISPRGNCPVLFGLRAKTHQSALQGCKYLIDSNDTEPVVGNVVFQTNQATDDHLLANLTATVKNVEVKQRGTVKLVCHTGETLMAFSESGDVKLLAQWLKPDDKISYNGLLSPDGAIHLERIKLVEAVPKKQRPKCNVCEVTLKSMGKGQQLRCPKCRKTSNLDWDFTERIPPFMGWVQPPKDSLRHLSKPLTG